MPPSEVPNGWLKTRLGDQLAGIRGGGTPARDVAAFWNGRIPWASVKDITAGVRTGTQESITEAGLRESASSIATAGTVVVATRMAVGKSVRFTVDVAINQDLKALIPHPSLSADFLHAWLHAHEGVIAAGATGSTVKGIRVEHLEAMEFLLPPLPEQKKIAAILTSVDEAIQATQAVIDQTRRVKEGLLQDLLTRGMPGHTRFKQTEIGEIPEGWEVRAVEDVCSRVGVGIASSATHAYRDTGVPLIRNQNIKYGYLDLSDLLYVDEAYDRENQTKRIHTGDVLTIRTGYPGVSAVVPPELNNAQSFTTLVSTPKPNFIRSQYLAAWINSPIGRRLVLAGEAGGAQHNLNAGELKRLPVPVPPLHEQDAIMASLGSVSATEIMEQAALERLGRAKSGLLQDLLTGRVRVSP
jgi:type I restriction enzyme, S subunit